MLYLGIDYLYGVVALVVCYHPSLGTLWDLCGTAAHAISGLISRHYTIPAK